jgi:hypothetical protein
MGGVVSAVTDIVSGAVETVGDVAGDAVEFVADTVDKTVTAIKEDPLKSAAIAAAAIATGGSSLAASLGTAGAAAAGAGLASTAIDVSRGKDLDDALKRGAVAAGAAYVGGNLVSQAGATDFLGSQSLGDLSTGAVGSGATGFGIDAGASGIGLNAGSGSLLGSTIDVGSALPASVSAPIPIPEPSFSLDAAIPTAEFGTFNPNIISPPSIDTSFLNSMEYLGGSTTLPIGTAGMTAEQIASSGVIGNVGANATSGLGYLGGSESLPAGTAGIKGLTTAPALNFNDVQRGLRLANSLFGQQPQQRIPQLMQRPQVVPQGVVDYSPILSLLQTQSFKPQNYSLLG